MAQYKKMSQEERKKLEREITSKLPNLSDEQLKKIAGGAGIQDSGGFGRRLLPKNGAEDVDQPINPDDAY